MEIGHIADELKLLASTGTKVPGFRRKVMVDIDRLITLGDEMCRSVPADMQEANEVIKMKESIINQAYMEAKRIRGVAEEEATALSSAAQQEHASKVDDSEVLRAAELKGQEIREEAAYEAQQILQDSQRKAYRMINESDSAAMSRRDGADHYAREVLFNLEEQMADVLGQVRRGIDALKLEIEASKKRQQQVQQMSSNLEQIPA
jgi:cell division septum initiation protein DivIVA